MKTIAIYLKMTSWMILKLKKYTPMWTNIYMQINEKKIECIQFFTQIHSISTGWEIVTKRSIGQHKLIATKKCKINVVSVHTRPHSAEPLNYPERSQSDADSQRKRPDKLSPPSADTLINKENIALTLILFY